MIAPWLDRPAPETPRPLGDEIIEFLAERPVAEKDALPVGQAIRERGDSLYVDLIWNLTNLRFDPGEAKRVWHEILAHKFAISEKLGRNVGIRVTALDYFGNIRSDLSAPRFVEPGFLERLYREATLDPLTGLPNRRVWRERLGVELARARRYNTPFTLAMMDLDNFKRLNDEHGHGAGDTALVSFAAAIRGSIRDTDLAARWGGEEFALLMPETAKREALRVMERIRIRSRENRVPVTFSGGLAQFLVDGESDDELFNFADRALYRAKGEGKNRVCVVPTERRAYPRLDETVPVRLEPLSVSDGAPGARIANISPGGFCCHIERALPIASPVHGEIELPTRTVSFTGRVIREETLDREGFEVAVEFTQIDAGDRSMILSYTT